MKGNLVIVISIVLIALGADGLTSPAPGWT